MRKIATMLCLLLVLLPAASEAQSFRTEAINNGNGFTGDEIFSTSTAAATGYDAYAVWDADNLYFGYTGQDTGDPACDPAESADCPIYETGQSTSKYIAYYLDTDPQDDTTGTTTAYTESGWTQSWTLPFNANYLVLIRTAGETTQEGFYTGNAFLYEWDGSAWTQVAAGAGPSGSSVLTIGDNNSSNYLEFSLERSAVGSPDFLRVTSWFFNTEDLASTSEDDRKSYAYWPASAPAEGEADSEGTTSGSTTLDAFYGFVLIGGQYPNASNGQANLNRPFFPGLTATAVNNGVPAEGSFGGTVPFHSLGYTNSNDFSGNELFSTSTPGADTGYDTYFTWDDANLYFGYTGSDVGGGDCSDLTVSSCNVFELGQSPNKWIILYLDTDPDGTSGTDQAASFGSQSWTLPFLADYYAIIRTDGVTVEGDYTGVADLKSWDGSQWVSQGPVDNLEIFDNSSSGFLKFALDLDAVGSPDFIKTAAWIFNTEDFASTSEDDQISYAYWPSSAADDSTTTSGSTTLTDYYGFELKSEQIPNGSNGLANLNRPFFGTYTCAPPADPGDNPGTSFPFHTIPINGSNSFNSSNEEFATSTTASTGYAAYATWDRVKLYFGYTGSDIGGGDCSDPSNPDCATYETGQDPQKWMVYFIDTDPTTSNGTTAAYVPPDTIATGQSWTLPFPADYAVYIRTDGTSRDASPYTGVAEVKRYAGGAWQSLGPCPLEIWDNNTSGYLEYSIDLTDLGSPSQIKVTSFLIDAGSDIGYAYWPEDAPASLMSGGTTSGATTMETYWGFELSQGQIPNSLGNKNKEFFESVPDQTTFNTYTINGTVDANEQLPQEYLGRESTSTAALYLTWDADNLYLSFADNPLVDTNSDLYLAFSTAPELSDDPRDGTGTASQPDVGVPASAYGQPTYPFAADQVLRFDGTTAPDDSVLSPAPGNLYTYASGSWSEEAMPSGTQIIRQESGPTEVAIPWSSVGIAADDYFHLVLYLNDSGNGVDQQWPPENPNAQNSDMTHFLSYYLREEAEPFSNAYKSVRSDQGSSLSERLYANAYLVVPNADQNSATWNLSLNTTIVNELFLGQSATLNVGSNSNNPSGFNELRFGRRITGIGDFVEQEGTVFTFDPAVGFPEPDQPEGGFATPSFTSTIACDVTFYDLVLLNDTEQVDCPSDAGTSTSVRAASVTASAPSVGADEVAALLPEDDPARKVAEQWPEDVREALAEYVARPSVARSQAAQAQQESCNSSLTIGGSVDISEGNLTTNCNELVLGEGATVEGRESGNRITGALTRYVETKEPVTLEYPFGGNVERDFELQVDQLFDWRTAYVVEEKLEPAPDGIPLHPLEEVSDVRYFTVEKSGDRFFGRGSPLQEARIVLPYGPDNDLGAPASFRVAQRWLQHVYVSRGGTLEAGSDAERGAVVSAPFLWLDGVFALATTDAEEAQQRRGAQAAGGGVPTEYALMQNYPNPFNPRTVIRYGLPEKAHVVLVVYDVLGRHVQTLVDADRPAGRHEATFDVRGLASGTYFYRLDAGAFSEVRRMVVVR